jgi:hypothetical protein
MPDVRHAGLCINGALVAAVVTLGRGGQHFAKPVGCDVNPCLVGQIRETFAAPGSNIRHDHLVAQMQLGFVHENPPAGSSLTELKRRTEDTLKCARRRCVPRRRSRMRDEAAVDDLGHEVRRDGLEVGVCRCSDG